MSELITSVLHALALAQIEDVNAEVDSSTPHLSKYSLTEIFCAAAFCLLTLLIETCFAAHIMICSGHFC